jgi:hypothetical protein
MYGDMPKGHADGLHQPIPMTCFSQHSQKIIFFRYPISKVRYIKKENKYFCGCAGVNRISNHSPDAFPVYFDHSIANQPMPNPIFNVSP